MLIRLTLLFLLWVYVIAMLHFLRLTVFFQGTVRFQTVFPVIAM